MYIQLDILSTFENIGDREGIAKEHLGLAFSLEERKKRRHDQVQDKHELDSDIECDDGSYRYVLKYPDQGSFGTHQNPNGSPKHPWAFKVENAIV